MISDTIYYIFGGLLVLGILLGISWMSNVKTAVRGNSLSAVCMALAIVLTLVKYDIVSQISLSTVMAASLILSIMWSSKIKMIAMPQTVALLNGFGGAASALVGVIFITGESDTSMFSLATAALAVGVGMITLLGSLIAAGKLSGKLSQKSTVWPAHQALTTLSLVCSLILVCIIAYDGFSVVTLILCIAVSSFFGVAFAIRVGGADMPITISLLNSLSGVAGSIAGMSIGDPLLVAVGGVVGASGLLLTQIMCRAMNRSLSDILTGKTTVSAQAQQPAAVPAEPQKLDIQEESPISQEDEKVADLGEVLAGAKKVIIIPGYGMALAQAQQLVKELSDKFEERGAVVDFAIHPVAGRMPGHMNVLLAEADVPYEKLREMDDINPEFVDCDIAIIIGANDVVNPAARDAQGTPIYGMPILAADEAKNVIICNYDLKPGYAGVENPLYNSKNALLLLGDAAETVKELIEKLG